MTFIKKCEYSLPARVSCGAHPKLTYLLCVPVPEGMVTNHDSYTTVLDGLNIELDCYHVSVENDDDGEPCLCLIIKLRQATTPADLRRSISKGKLPFWTDILYCPISSTRKGMELLSGLDRNPLISSEFLNNERRKPHLNGLQKKRKIKDRVVFKKQQDVWIAEKKELFELIIKCDWSAFSKPDNCDRFITSWNVHADKETKPCVFARGAFFQRVLRRIATNLATKKLVSCLIAHKR